MNFVNNGKCVLSLCKFHLTISFSTGLLSVYQANALDTLGIDARVRGSSFVEAHFRTKCFANM